MPGAAVSDSQFLLQEFEASLKTLWLRIWGTLVLERIAVRAASLIDVADASLATDWESLDNPRARGALVPNTRPTWDALIPRLMDKKTSRADILAAFKRASRREPNAETLTKALDALLPTLINRRSSQETLAANPFPAAWPLVANELARLIYDRNTPKAVEPEWKLLNGLTIAGLLAASRLPAAKHVRQVVEQARHKIMSVRGSLFRIPELINTTGIKDVPIKPITRTGGLSLHHRALTDLLTATELESSEIYLGRGGVHQRLGTTGPTSVPRTSWGRVTPSQLVQGRSERFKLYEFTIIAYLALSCIEQLLRSWAHREGVPHMKPSGQPKGVLDWCSALSTNPHFLNAIDVLYDSSGQNIRNRIMHGNLLELEGKDLEVALPIADPRTFGYMKLMGPDPYSPENIAQQCLNVLEIVDREINGTRPLIAADLAWAQGPMLSNDDIDFGLALVDGWSGPDAQRWLNTVTDYMSAIQPGLKQLFTMGLVEWLDANRGISIPRFMGLGLTFEAVYRSTVHLRGISVLQYEHRKVDKSLKFQYRMLDPRPTSIFSDKVVDCLVEHVKPEERGLARRILKLAVDARNAIAHGAVTSFDLKTAYSMGHLIVKATETLVTSGLHHMTAETAFMDWRSDRHEEHGHDVEDWFAAQRKVINRVHFAAKN